MDPKPWKRKSPWQGILILALSAGLLVLLVLAFANALDRGLS